MAQEKGVLVEVLEWGRMGGLSLESALCGLEECLIKPCFVSAFGWWYSPQVQLRL